MRRLIHAFFLFVSQPLAIQMCNGPSGAHPSSGSGCFDSGKLRILSMVGSLCGWICSWWMLTIVKAKVVTGTDVREEVLISRIQLSPTDTIHPFTFCRRQFPIRLCYAMTINKSQGQNLKQVALYLSRPVFTHGQLYVAMSRVTTPYGLKILDKTSGKDGEDGVTNIVYKEIFKDIQVTQIDEDTEQASNGYEIEED